MKEKTFVYFLHYTLDDRKPLEERVVAVSETEALKDVPVGAKHVSATLATVALYGRTKRGEKFWWLGEETVGGDWVHISDTTRVDGTNPGMAYELALLGFIEEDWVRLGKASVEGVPVFLQYLHQEFGRFSSPLPVDLLPYQDKKEKHVPN